jgi:hypothetical protein
MALFVCPTCAYSTQIKCNYQKHVTKTKCKNEDALKQQYTQDFAVKLEKNMAKFKELEEKLIHDYEEEIKRLKGIIHDLKKKKKPDDDDETYRIRLMKMCKRKGIAYNEEDSLDTLRKLYTSQQGGN